MSEEKNQKSDNTVLFSVLSYIGILWLIGLLADKENAAVRFHVNQGILLTILSLVSSVLAVIPIVGAILSGVLGIVGFVLMILGILNAVKKEQKPLPLIGNLYTFVK